MCSYWTRLWSMEDDVVDGSVDVVVVAIESLLDGGGRDLAPSSLTGGLVRLAAHLAAGTGRFAVLSGELDARGDTAVAGLGEASLTGWLVRACGMSLVTAREHVRTARALRALPATTAALCAGSLSWAKARAIARVATPATDTVWCEQSGHADGGAARAPVPHGVGPVVAGRGRRRRPTPSRRWVR